MSSNSEDSSSSGIESIDNEPISKYKKGGYYPVSIGEIFNNRYRIIKKIGWGVFSTVWIAYDYKESNIFKVLKIQQANESERSVSQDEIDIAKKINIEFGCKLIENFMQESMFGNHLVLVFNLFGENLLSVIRNYHYNGINERVVKKITLKLLQILQHIHEDIGIIHTDIKPENILISKPSKKINHLLQKYKIIDIECPIKLVDKNKFTLSKSQKKRQKKLMKKRVIEEDDVSSSDDETYLERSSDIRIVDFGNSQWLDNKEDIDIQTRQYRSPEVIIGNIYNQSADIWSSACVIFELLTGENLFNPIRGKNFDIEDSHISLMISYLSEDFTAYKSCKYYDMFFNKDDNLINIQNIRKITIKKLLKKYKFLDSNNWCKLLESMLVIDYEKRPSASELLNTFQEWLSN
jgi:serine/threonine-protein kinase SRPK3